jgi:DHA1 family multidrug resistance protein-like MFS transporter
MQEEDYEILRNEANATPRRYSEWDQQGQMRREYAALHDNDPRFLNAQPATPETAHTQNAQNIKEEHETVAAKEEVAAPLTRQSSASSSSTTSSNSTHSARLEEIRTAHSTPARDRRPTINSQASSGNFLQLHPTERNPEAIRRIETHRSQHRSTVGTEDVPSRLTRTITRRKTEKPLPSLGAGKPFPPLLPDREEYVVEFDGVDDPLHAQNWPTKKKLGIAAILAFDALAATMGSSIFSSATRVIAVKYHVAPVVATLGTSLFVFGYAFGPLVCFPTAT